MGSIYLAGLIVLELSTSVPQVNNVRENHSQQNTGSNIDRAVELSHDLLKRDFKTQWVDPSHPEEGVFLQVKAPGFYQAVKGNSWVSYKIPFSALKPHAENVYLLEIPDKIDIAYKTKYICGEAVDGVVSIEFLLPGLSVNHPQVTINNYRVTVDHLEQYQPGMHGEIPLLPDCN